MARTRVDTGLAKKLNLGCGGFPMEGYINVDLEPPADVIGDFTTDFEFTDVEEVRMHHVLEHISWQRTNGVLRLIHSWMLPESRIIVEVPDMAAIFVRGLFDDYAQVAIYGIQSAPGEFHMAGFTKASLSMALAKAGFANLGARCFASDHPARMDFPCIEAIAVRP